jgi:peptidoglycan/LPS O-acetylase OafA/YrhL
MIVAFVSAIVSRHLIYMQFASGAVDDIHGYWRVYLRTNYRLDGLAVGGLLATLSLKPSRFLLAVGLLAGVTLCLLVFAGPWPDWVTFQWFGIIALVFGSFASLAIAFGHWKCWLIPGTREMANLSYSIYLTHPILIRIVERLLPGVSWGWRLAFFIVGTMGASLALRYLVELPFLSIRDRRSSPSTFVDPARPAITYNSAG